MRDLPECPDGCPSGYCHDRFDGRPRGCRHDRCADCLPVPLARLLAAEAAAEAPACGADPADLEQAVRLRLLERTRAGTPPPRPAAWLCAAVRAEARAVRRRTGREVPYDTLTDEPAAAAPVSPESAAVAAERRAALHAVVARLPGRCPLLVAALLTGDALRYRDIAGALGISQGSVGPSRSRCLAALRRMLLAEVGPAAGWGKWR